MGLQREELPCGDGNPGCGGPSSPILQLSPPREPNPLIYSLQSAARQSLSSLSVSEGPADGCARPPVGVDPGPAPSHAEAAGTPRRPSNQSGPRPCPGFGRGSSSGPTGDERKTVPTGRLKLPEPQASETASAGSKKRSRDLASRLEQSAGSERRPLAAPKVRLRYGFDASSRTRRPLSARHAK